MNAARKRPQDQPMQVNTLHSLAGSLLLASALCACGGDAAPTAAPMRAVKLETVGADAPSAQLRYSAVVRQRERAELGFEAGGRVTAILVDVGSSVRKGQLLARLDAEAPRQRAVQAAANVSAAEVQLQERQAHMRQQQAMFDDGAIAQAGLSTARTALEAAQAQLQVARSERALAARTQRLTELRAPFDASVVARLIQPQAEAAPGQAVLQLEGAGQAQAVALLPPAQAALLRPGARVEARDSAGRPWPLRTDAIASRLESGAAVQVIFNVERRPAALRSGENLLLDLPAAAAPGLSVPLAAVLPAVQGAAGKVFVYQPAGAMVRQRQVSLGRIDGDRIQVTAGLVAGEQVAAAGAAFLGDGQKVTPYQGASRLNEKEAQ
ncbi:RND family efflux transporter, MFP subunit [Janthinobacterium psychrotolerans]|uniref:RND family efflux transporter, MFP subunit n=2 Tax=Janthinobacterium psychrotolerans TaxID=1747903 RepID=A0A1A7C3T2_9BURK|nr:RND family efflux transporter, MFP subunit [Janthinobacterium psychrotolerans]